MNKNLRKEIEALAVASDNGKPTTDVLVDFAASHPKSALYADFDQNGLWDLDKAARIAQKAYARKLIQGYVTVLPNRPIAVHGFVSLPSDRVSGGGYRLTEKVMKNNKQRSEMVAEALATVSRIRHSFAYLSDLDEFFDALDRLIKKEAEKHGLASKAA